MYVPKYFRKRSITTDFQTLDILSFNFDLGIVG